MAPPRCLCQAIFGTITALHLHTNQHGHSFQCGCGDFFATKDRLKEHQKDDWSTCKSSSAKQLTVDSAPASSKKYFFCRMCTMRFQDPNKRDTHLVLRHHACPTCLQTFRSLTARKDHQKTTGHCYCPDCSEDGCTETGKAFASLREVAHHNCADIPYDSFECLTCGDDFEDALDFTYHIDRQGHTAKNTAQESQLATATLQLARVEESNIWCEQCNKRFARLVGYTAHKKSSKHKAPLVAIDCKCGKEFGLVSGFLAHMESGMCDGGMTRKKLNAIVYHYDKDRHITLAEHADHVHDSLVTGSSQASIMPDDSASTHDLSLESLSLDSSFVGTGRGRIFTPDDSDTKSLVSSQGGVILTPDSSDYTSTDGETIATPSTSDTASTLSDGSAILTPSASTGSTSSDGVMVTPPGSTISDSNASITSSASTSNYNILTPSTASLTEGRIQPTPSGSSDSDASGEWSFLNPSRMLTPASTSADESSADDSSSDGSSVSTIRFDSLSKVWPCSKCTKTFPAKTQLLQHIKSAVHGAEIFHCPTASPDAALPHLEDRKFKSMSGLVQHIENESCNGGIDALKAIIDVMEQPMKKKLGASITSLKE
jgi:hypothetical protein